MKNDLSIWLVPRDPDLPNYQSIIDRLALTYDAATFLPHVTLYGGQGDPSVVTNWLANLHSRVRALPLIPKSLEVSEEFTKTLYIDFEPSADAGALFEMTVEMNVFDTPYRFFPHLSLLYQSLGLPALEAIKSEIFIDRAPVVFDELVLMETPSPVASVGDVKEWRIISRTQLG